MKNFIALLACACLGLVLLAGCSSTGSNSATPMGDSVKVALLFSAPTKAYSDVCAVSVVKMQPSGETWQSAMQKQAAAHGADAVIVDTTTINNNTSSIITGKAIRYQ
jgi:hypothetical protein